MVHKYFIIYIFLSLNIFPDLYIGKYLEINIFFSFFLLNRTNAWPGMNILMYIIVACGVS